MSRIFGLVWVLCSLAAAQQPQAPRAITPFEAGANLPAQKIGANDLIAVAVYDAPEMTRTVRVGADGAIRLPMVKQRIQAAGLMPSDVETRITAALRAEQLFVDPVVTVTIAEYTSRPISVAGAVRKPLTFQAAGPVTLLDAITRAEGLTPEAGPEILVSRAQPGDDGKPLVLTQRIFVKQLIDAADPEVNLKLVGGEEIRVPDVGKIFVLGNVKKPGAFSVHGSQEPTVLQMLALAEGLMPFAAKQAFIYRREASGAKNEIPIDLGDIMKRKKPDVPLVAQDLLYIPDRSGKRATLAAIEKMVIFGTGASTALIYGAAVH
jgi:polysaccharide biosynthesis/export protein